MQTISPQPLPVNPPNTLPQQPKQGGSKLMALMIASIIVLLAAIGFVVWVFVSRAAPTTGVNTPPPDDTKDVKSVTFVASPTLPPVYAAVNQTANGVIRVHYYDNATNCGVTMTVAQKAANKTAKDTIIDTINAAYADGITTIKTTPGEQITLKESGDSGKQYAFDVIEFEQQLVVPGVAFAAQVNTIAYKQFGSQVAALSYGCKTETWPIKKAELTDQIKAFTVKTER